MDWVEEWKSPVHYQGQQSDYFLSGSKISPKGEGKSWQLQEVAGWAFFLSNLKSVATKGPDLRNKNPKVLMEKRIHR